MLHASWRDLQVGRAKGVTLYLYSGAAVGKFFACYTLVGGTYR